MNNSDRIQEELKELIVINKIHSSDVYERNVFSFFKQCPDDGMLNEAHIRWDREENEFDIIWDTSNLDVRFSIGIKECSWGFWAGENHHRKDDKCFCWGFGGEDIDDKDLFATYFFDCMNDEWRYHKEYWSPYKEK